MSEIPSDIWDAALACIAELNASVPGVFLPSDADVIIAGAILAERERCAKVASSCRTDIENNPHDFGPMDQGGIRAADKIEAFIRRGSP